MTPSNNIQDLFNVNGLVAVITGGGSGLGLYAARALDANGAKAVYIVGRRETTLREAASTAVNGTIIPLVGDVTDKASLQQIAEQIRKEQGHINLLFANAGVSGPCFSDHLPAAAQAGISKPTLTEWQTAAWAPSTADFTSTSHTNVTAVFYTCVAFLDLLSAGNQARNVPQDAQILVTSSEAGFNRVGAHGFAYSISKAALNHLAKMLSTAFAQNAFRIRVNVIAPGLYPSEQTEYVTARLSKFAGVEGHERVFEGAYRLRREDIPAERTGSEEEFAGAVLFMASKAGAYLNGEMLLSDGGRVAQCPATY